MGTPGTARAAGELTPWLLPHPLDPLQDALVDVDPNVLAVKQLTEQVAQLHRVIKQAAAGVRGSRGRALRP